MQAWAEVIAKDLFLVFLMELLVRETVVVPSQYALDLEQGVSKLVLGMEGGRQHVPSALGMILYVLQDVS